MNLLGLKISFKRMLFTTVAVAVYSIFFAFIAFGDSSSENLDGMDIVATPSNIFSSLVTEAFGTSAADWNLDFTDIFSNQAAGQNLYVMIYQKVNVEPEKNALKESAQAFGITLAEADAVMKGSPEPFLNQAGKTYTQAQALNRVTEFLRQLDEKRKENQFQADMVNEFAPTEIFYNGDLLDSGFDLIYDLQIIEQILFNSTEKIQLAGEYTGGLPPKPLLDHDPNVDLSPQKGIGQKEPSDVSNAASKDELDVPSLDEALKSGQSDKSSSTGDSANKEEVPWISDEILYRSDTGDLNDPDVCETDDKLGHALDNASDNPVAGDHDYAAYYDKNYANEGANGNNGSVSENSDSSAGSDSSIDSSEDFKSEAQKLEEDLAAAEKAYDDIKLSDIVFAGLKDYQDKEWCEGPFCLEVNFKYKTASMYTPGETCVACEIEKINDNLWDTIKNNLNSNKAPGNVFESAKCKYGLISNPNLNVIWLGNPIKFPSNADLIQNKSIIDRWNEFMKIYKPDFWSDQYNKRDNSPVDKEKQEELENKALDIDPRDKAALEATNFVSDSVTQADLEAQINKIVQDSVDKINRDVETFEKGSTAAEFGDFYQLLSNEMDRMDTYFKLYKQAFENISANSCPKNKPDVK